MTTEILERPDTDERVVLDDDPDYERYDGDDPAEASHIVLEKDGKTAHQLVTESRIFGTEIEALCGYVWVASKDPENLPVCGKCLDIYHQPGDNRDDRERLPDSA